MDLYDVNVLIAARCTAHPRHGAARVWFEQQVNAPAAFGMAEMVLAGYLRIATNPRVFSPPATMEEALGHVRAIIERPNCVLVRPGTDHFALFTRLCRDGKARGNLVSDAYLAALAMEAGCRWLTFNRDFARFPGLDWAEPELRA
jgi:toxin-antitoxin system PIN domain toxin